MATSEKQTNTSFENLRFDPFLSNIILLDDQNDPDVNFFNRDNMKSIDTQYFREGFRRSNFVRFILGLYMFYW